MWEEVGVPWWNPRVHAGDRHTLWHTTNVDHVDRTLVALVISDTLLRYASLMYVKLAVYQALGEEGENTIIWISKTSIWFLCKEYMYVIQKMLSNRNGQDHLPIWVTMGPRFTVLTVYIIVLKMYVGSCNVYYWYFLCLYDVVSVCFFIFIYFLN